MAVKAKKALETAKNALEVVRAGEKMAANEEKRKQAAYKASFENKMDLLSD